MEIDIFHARILRHSLEFGTVLGYFYIAILKSHTVVKQFGFDGKSRGCLGRGAVKSPSPNYMQMFYRIGMSS